MLGPLAVLCALLFPGGGAGLKLEQTPVVVERLGTSATLPCTVDSSVYYIHWYFHREGIAPRRLLYIHTDSSSVQRDASVNMDKVNAKMHKNSYNCNLLVQKLEKSDEGVYYCAAWEELGYSWYNKVFGPGTVLRVTDKNPDEDIPPKPTVFLPSITEIKVHNTGTYLCLLEDFFPDVIKIDWKKKDDKTVLQSQQGDTMKTKDTYMKFSWLTVTQESMAKDHKCMVKHERNKGRVDQEIDFPSISRILVAAIQSNMDSQRHSETRRKRQVVTVSPLSSQSFSPAPSTVDNQQLQVMNTSAYYTYILLLFKSLMYSIIITICLLRRPALDDNRKN